MHVSLLITIGGLAERKICGSTMKKTPFCLVIDTRLSLSLDLDLFLFRGIRSLEAGSRHENPRPRSTQRLQGRVPSHARWHR